MGHALEHQQAGRHPGLQQFLMSADRVARVPVARMVGGWKSPRRGEIIGSAMSCHRCARRAPLAA
jgi:hypothetical protein